ncbi:MAG: glycosyltransferase family 39 protein, partial [Thermosynechococcaceae cyanobacterium]
MLLLIIGLGILLRVLFFPHIPPGLNQDEASAAYEAYSLLLTGQDRWGNPWPIYFPSWGSGQNVLYSYLSIPAIWLWGLNLFTTRLVNLVFGILTLPLLYLCVRSVFNRRIATLSTLLLAVLPWHVMMSRWGLESNLLPFFLLLGIYTVHLAFKSPHPKAWMVFALVPWAICFYAYGTSLLLVPPLLLLIGVTYRQKILRHKWLWSGALGLFLLLALPFLLFILKNNVLHHPLGFEQRLSFSIPMLNAQRGEQIDASFLERLVPNIHLLLNGFGDDLIWNSPQYFLPLGIIAFPLLGVGLAQVSRQPKAESTNLFGLWLWAGLPLFFMVPLNVNRANGLLLPIIVLSVVGFEALRKAIAAPEIRHVLVRLTAIWLALNTCLFSAYYLSSAYS